MNDAPLMAAYAELRRLTEAEHVPVGVKEALFSLSQHQTKLFVTVLEKRFALRAPGSPIRLEPSKFLVELLKTMRTLDWPRVLVLIHNATLPAETNDEIIANRLAIIGQILIRMEPLLEKMAEESTEQTHILKSIAKTLDEAN